MNAQEQVTASNGHTGAKVLPLAEHSQQTDAPDHTVKTPAAARPRSRRTRRLALVAGALIALGRAAYWLYARQFEETDDAQIDGNISNGTPRIGGTLKSVFVVENQRVTPGDLPAKIDPADLEVAVAQAKAAVAQAEAQLRA